MFIINLIQLSGHAMNYPTQTDNENKCTTYNGWSNYETWNVALWMDNDYGNYLKARESANYDEFVSKLHKCLTGDGVSFTDEKLNIQELDEKIQELNS